MKLLRILIFSGCLLVIGSFKLFAQKEIFIKQIEFELPRISDIDYENEYFVTMKFNKGSKYTFKITNGINDRPGVSVLQIMDADNLILTNELGDKYYESVNFFCNKTEFYDVLVKFKDEKLGHCQIDITLVQ